MADPRFKNLEIKVGLFIFVSIIMIAFMVIGFLVTQDVFTRKVKVMFVAASGEGLSKSMPVMYSGFQIGRVQDIELRDDGNVELQAKIPERYKKWVKPDSTATIQAQGVIGANSIVLAGGDMSAAEIKDGQTYMLKREKGIPDLLAKIEPMIEDLKNIFQNIDNVTTSISKKSPMLENFMEGAGALGNDMKQKKGSLGYLVRSDYLKDQVQEIVAQIKVIEGNVQKITEKVDTRVDDTKPVIQDLDKGIIAIKEGAEKIGKLAKNLDTTVNKIQPTLNNTNKISTDVAGATTNLADIRKQADEILSTTNRVLLNLEDKWPFDSKSEKKADEKVQLP